MQAEALLDHAVFVRGLAESLTFGGEDPDDFVQQTWLAAIEHPPAADPGIKGWLATVLRNALRQDRRSRSRRIARETLAPEPKATPSPDEIREREEVRREVVMAVLELDEPYRTVVLLRYYEELPPREIAGRTGDPVETVKTRLARARKKLRERLDAQHGSDGSQWGFAVASLVLWPGEGAAAAAPASDVSLGTFALGLVGLVVLAVVAAVGISVLSPSPGENGPDRASVTEEHGFAVAEREVTPAPPEEGGTAAGPDGRRPGADRGKTEAGATTRGRAPDHPSDAPVPGAARGETSEGATIQGRVLDHASDAPIPGATVRLVVMTEPMATTDVVADEDGRFQFTDVPCGVKTMVFVRGRDRLLSLLEDRPERVLKSGAVEIWDLKGRSRAGIDLRVHLRLPEGCAPPEAMRLTITSVNPGIRSVDLKDCEVDGVSRVLTVFLPVGRHEIGFESPKWQGEIPPIEVSGAGSPRTVVLELRRRTGVHLRLVDGEGRPFRRGPVRVLVTMIVTSTDSMGNSNYTRESLNYHETNERGELDLTQILPAMNTKTMLGNKFGFAFKAEGTFAGTMSTPNFEIEVTEILARRERQGGGAVVIEVPAIPYKMVTARITDSNGKPVEGVQVVGRPASRFMDDEYVSDREGRIAFRLLEGDRFPMPPQMKRDGSYLVARSPWIGRAAVAALEREPIPGQPWGVMVVTPVAEIRLKLLDDSGKPLPWTHVTIDGEAGKTDGAGAVRGSVAATAKTVEVRIPGYFPERVAPAGPGEETTVRLVPAREIRVRCLMPDGIPTMLQVLARVAGEEREYRPVGFDQEARTVVLLVPHMPVTVMTDPRVRGLTGERVVPVGESEVDLQLERK